MWSFSKFSAIYCVWALTSKSDWIEILLTGQILYSRLRLVMSHQAVSLHERLYCGLLMKAFFRTPVVGAPAWLQVTGVWHCSEVCNRVHQTYNFVLRMKIIQPYCLKASQEKNREESIRNVMPDMTDEGKDEGWMSADNMNFTSSS